MKSTEQVMPVIKKIYEEKLHKNQNEIIKLIIDKNHNYIVLKDDWKTTILRKDIDDYFDPQKETKQKRAAELKIIHALENFEKID
ncbi:MAG: hypothetical protein AB1545_15650 [Thermodesulfobacteriota bacterium]